MNEALIAAMLLLQPAEVTATANATFNLLVYSCAQTRVNNQVDGSDYAKRFENCLLRARKVRAEIIQHLMTSGEKR